MPREEMNGASNICSPPSDRQMERTRDGSVPRLLTWHACQGYQIVRGKDGSRAKTKTKKKEGTVLSQAGRAGRDRAER